MSAISHWKHRVAAYNAQFLQAQIAVGETTQDSWEPLTTSFQADPRRTDDVEVNRLLQEVHAATTLLDVGGGAGRFALPLALHCKHVTVVEPSASMGDSLRQVATETGITNVTIVAQRWEEAEVEPADVVLCAHVVYTIEDVQPFVGRLVQYARDKVVMPTHVRPPMSRFDPFWLPVHGEDKHQVPGLAEFMQVLWDMDIYAQLDMFAPVPVRPFKTWDRALHTLRQRLCVIPDSDKDTRLQQAMHTLLIETPTGYVIKGTKPARLALLAWCPER